MNDRTEIPNHVCLTSKSALSPLCDAVSFTCTYLALHNPCSRSHLNYILCVFYSKYFHCTKIQILPFQNALQLLLLHFISYITQFFALCYFKIGLRTPGNSVRVQLESRLSTLLQIFFEVPNSPGQKVFLGVLPDKTSKIPQLKNRAFTQGFLKCRGRPGYIHRFFYYLEELNTPPCVSFLLAENIQLNSYLRT